MMGLWPAFYRQDADTDDHRQAPRQSFPTMGFTKEQDSPDYREEDTGTFEGNDGRNRPL